jgi:hypothetical protein
MAGSPGWLVLNAEATQQVASVNASVSQSQPAQHYAQATQQVSSVSASVSQSQPAQLFQTLSVLIGDINADGYPDFALSDPFNGPQGRVELRSGSTGAVLRTFESPAGESSFGGSTFPSCDMDGDGVADVAIASILPKQAGEEKGIVRVYSSTTGKELAYIKELNAANIAYTDLKVIGDPNNDKIIDETDLLLTINTVQRNKTLTHSLQSYQLQADQLQIDSFETDPLQVDLNKDGAVDAQDIFELIGKLGQVSPAQCEMALVNLLNAAGEQMQDPNWQWTENPQGQSAQAMIAGPFGCVWCFIKCGRSINKAKNCGELYRAHVRDVCEPLADKGLIFEYSQCLDDARFNILLNCVGLVARAAGECGPCVTKCGPQPSR